MNLIFDQIAGEKAALKRERERERTEILLSE